MDDHTNWIGLRMEFDRQSGNFNISYRPGAPPDLIIAALEKMKIRIASAMIVMEDQASASQPRVVAAPPGFRPS